MILLCNYQCELGEPVTIKMLATKKLACLYQLKRHYYPELAHEEWNIIYVFTSMI